MKPSLLPRRGAAEFPQARGRGWHSAGPSGSGQAALRIRFPLLRTLRADRPGPSPRPKNACRRGRRSPRQPPPAALRGSGPKRARRSRRLAAARQTSIEGARRVCGFALACRRRGWRVESARNSRRPPSPPDSGRLAGRAGQKTPGGMTRTTRAEFRSNAGLIEWKDGRATLPRTGGRISGRLPRQRGRNFQPADASE